MVLEKENGSVTKMVHLCVVWRKKLVLVPLRVFEGIIKLKIPMPKIITMQNNIKTFFKTFLITYLSFNFVGFVLAIYRFFNGGGNESWEGFTLHFLYTLILAIVFVGMLYVAHSFNRGLLNSKKVVIFLAVVAHAFTLLLSEMLPSYLLVSVLVAYLVVIFLGIVFWKRIGNIPN